MTDEFIPQRGYYRKLRVYQIAEIIYDVTYIFTQRFLSKGDRTVDQMVQAARSGKQNIAEGSAAGSTSKETEIKLTNVAKASLQELLIDYEDFIRTRDFELWEKNSPKAVATRRICATNNLILFQRSCQDTQCGNCRQYRNYSDSSGRCLALSADRASESRFSSTGRNPRANDQSEITIQE